MDLLFKLCRIFARLLALAFGLVMIVGGGLLTLCVAKTSASGDPLGLIGWVFVALGLWMAVAALRALWRVLFKAEEGSAMAEAAAGIENEAVEPRKGG